MILIITSLILSLIFMILGGFHFYWIFGGIMGINKVIPSINNTTKKPTIPKLATLIVALVLTSFSLLYLLKSGLINFDISPRITTYSYTFIPLIFILRAIGEFKYLGFFKKIKNTEFAKADSKFFSPLCLGIGILGFLIEIL